MLALKSINLKNFLLLTAINVIFSLGTNEQLYTNSYYLTSSNPSSIQITAESKNLYKKLTDQQIVNTKNQLNFNNQVNLQSQDQPVLGQQETYQHPYHTPADAQFWWNSLLALVLTITGAFCSGMGVGYCNIDKLQLEVMSMSKNPYEKKMAKTILEVVKNHHLWLVTLLVYNAIALESLPLVVHTLMPDWAAIIFSTIIVLIAAQIVPQAICTGPKKIILAYYASPIVIWMRKILFFIVYPVSAGLDKLLGTHSHTRIQHKDFANFLTGNQILKKTQKMLLTSTLQLRCQRVLQKMIPLKKLYMIQASETLTRKKIDQMLANDYSHVLVYKQDKKNIIGQIKVKQFALKYLKSYNTQFKAQQVMNGKNAFLSVYMDTNLLQMLMLFQANSNRIALICEQKKKVASGIPSIMYTKNDMLMKKKGANIIGAIFLYQIFDQLTDIEHHTAPSISKQNLSEEQMKEMKQLKEPLIKRK